MASRAFNRIPTRSGRNRKNKSTGTYLLFSGLALFICAFLSVFFIAFLEMPPSWLYRWSYFQLYVAIFFGLAITIMYSGGLSLIHKTFTAAARSEERRVGKEWVSTCRYRCSPFHKT